MPLITEYAITPAVFEHYSSDEIIYSNFALLKEALFNEGIVRNLYGGEWLNMLNDPSRSCHRKGKELLKKLKQKNRLRDHPVSHLPFPNNDHGWCEEALLSHESIPLGGLVTIPETVSQYSRTHPLIASIGRLSSAKWWSQRGGSTRLCRNTASYLEHLRLVLECSNSLMFIDPYLDPTQSNYSEFIKILEALKVRKVPPVIEIHRTVHAKDRKGQVVYHDIGEWKRRFCDSFSQIIRQLEIKVEVFLWEKGKNMHDRYLASDIIGISAPYGFDTSKKLEDKTTWTRLSETDRDGIVREYDPVCNPKNFHKRFVIT